MSEHIQESKVNEDFGELLAAANLNSAGAPSKVSANFTFDAYKMPKINCFYHKGQTITNFCCSPQCLIPLCPICVPLHAQEHSQDGTFPKLECLELILNDIYQTMATECIDSLKLANLLVDAFNDLTQHVIQMQQSAQITHVKLSETKARVIKVVEQFFHSLENDIFNKQKKNAQNQNRDAEYLKQLVRDRWESHMQFLQDLNSVNSMKSVIPYFGSTILEDNTQYFQVIGQYLTRFKDVQSEVAYDQSKAADLSAHLGAIIKVRHMNVPEYLAIHELPHPNLSQSRPLNEPIFPKQVKQTIIQHSIPMPPMLSSNPLSQSNRPMPLTQSRLATQQRHQSKIPQPVAPQYLQTQNRPGHFSQRY